LLSVFEVIEVRKGSPAEKCGFKVGDELISVNGLLCREMRLNEVNAMLNAKPGKKIRISILRQNVKYDLTIALESQI
jgi:C-terminal processing protease CtpA/Prc